MKETTVPGDSMRAVVFSGALVCVLASCGPRQRALPSASPPPTSAPTTEPPAPLPVADAGPALDEIAARTILAARFRDAGFRIRYDVTLTLDSGEVTLDGFDPARAVGFEYVDPREQGVDLDAAARTALAGHPTARVLVIDPTDEAGLRERMERFLATVTR